MNRNVLAVSVAAAVSCLSAQVGAADKASEPAATNMQNDAVTFPLSVFDEQQKAAIEDIVREYLIAHPEILVDMTQKLQQKQLAAQEQMSKKVIENILQDDALPMEGNPNAKHYLIEFFDYNCGYCKGAREMLYRLAKEYDLKVYYMEMPVLSPMSVRASAIGLALFNQDKAKYLEYQKYLMGQSERLTEEAQIKAAVEQVGADYDALAERVNNDPQVQVALRKNMEYGDELGMQGVPLFIIDGHILRGAVKDYESLKGFLKDE